VNDTAHCGQEMAQHATNCGQWSIIEEYTYKAYNLILIKLIFKINCS
jgi:hypothetical protein